MITSKISELETSKEKGIALGAQLRDKVIEIDKYFKEIGADPISLTFKDMDKNTGGFVAEMTLRKEDAIYVADRLIKSEFEKDKLVYSLAENKDFNDDLKEEISSLISSEQNIVETPEVEVKSQIKM